jgi:hypothetical protein
MKLFFRILYWTSLLFIGACLLVSLLIRITPLDFASASYGNRFDVLFFGGIPAAILLTISRIGFKSMDRTGKRNTIIRGFLLSVGCLIVFFLYALMTWSDGLCRYVTLRTLFTNRTVPSTHIILRGYGCGAVDGGPPNLSTVKVKSFTPVFNYSSPVDTSKINKEEWIRVEEE